MRTATTHDVERFTQANEVTSTALMNDFVKENYWTDIFIKGK
jgi:hypothetical protein